MRAVLLLALLLSASALACPHDASVRRQFQRLNPCPATGHKSGACRGWVVDHIVPLCANGPDKISNLQWQTTADAKRKDVIEREQCRRK